MYLTYAEYVAMGGTLAEGDFPRAEMKARKRVDSMTQGRVAAMATVPQEVKSAVMELINVDQTFGAQAQASAPVVESFSTDGYSEKYGGTAEREALARRVARATVDALLYGVVDDKGTPLLFTGIGCP